MGDGSLCLLQADAQWSPRDSATDLILKAAGWRVEFELMRVGAIKQMTINGIVSDDIYDDLIARIATSMLDTSDTEQQISTAGAE